MPYSQSLRSLYCKTKQNRPLMAAPFDKSVNKGDTVVHVIVKAPAHQVKGK